MDITKVVDHDVMPEPRSGLRHHLHRKNAPTFSDKPGAKDGEKAYICTSIDKGLAKLQVLTKNIANITLRIRNDLEQVISISTTLKAAYIFYPNPRIENKLWVLPPH